MITEYQINQWFDYWIHQIKKQPSRRDMFKEGAVEGIRKCALRGRSAYQEIEDQVDRKTIDRLRSLVEQLESIGETPGIVRDRMLEGVMGWRYEHPDRYPHDEAWQRILETGTVVKVSVTEIDA